MFIKIGLVILVAIASVLTYAGLQSADYEIKREIAIDAPAEKIFPLIRDLMTEWARKPAGTVMANLVLAAARSPKAFPMKKSLSSSSTQSQWK